VDSEQVPQNFHQPDEFMSERWLKKACPPDFSSDKRIVRNHSVVGHGNILRNGWWQPEIVSAFVLCENHSLVWAEMRFISAHMLWCFDPECHPESRNYIDACKTFFILENSSARHEAWYEQVLKSSNTPRMSR
jgi:hypothetical protein